MRRLIGVWKVEGVFVGGPPPPSPVRGTMTVRWLVRDALVVMRSRLSGGPPASTAVLGADDTTGAFFMLYSDVRGVVRVYAMTMTPRRWTLMRRAPGFWQRFTGNIARNARTIHATWELSPDGRRWTLDLRLTFTKQRSLPPP